MDKTTAKQAALILCKRVGLETKRVGRWKWDGLIFKRLFNCVTSRGNDISIEIKFRPELNAVEIWDYCRQSIIDDFKPGRFECDDEIEFELKSI